MIKYHFFRVLVKEWGANNALIFICLSNIFYKLINCPTHRLRFYGYTSYLPNKMHCQNDNKTCCHSEASEVFINRLCLESEQWGNMYFVCFVFYVHFLSFWRTKERKRTKRKKNTLTKQTLRYLSSKFSNRFA